MNNIEKLNNILANADNIKKAKGYDTVIKRTIALLIDEGVSFEEENGRLIISNGEKEYFVSRNYAEAYLGHSVVSGNKNLAVKPKNDEIQNLSQAEDIISEIYRALIAGNQFSGYLKKKKSQEKGLQQQLKELKDEVNELNSTNSRLREHIVWLENRNEQLQAKLFAEQEKVKFLLDGDEYDDYDDYDSDDYDSYDESDYYNDESENISETPHIDSTGEYEYENENTYQNEYSEEDKAEYEAQDVSNDTDNSENEDYDDEENASDEYTSLEDELENSEDEEETDSELDEEDDSEDVPGFDGDDGFVEYKESESSTANMTHTDDIQHENAFAFPYQDDIYELARSEFILATGTISKEINGRVNKIKILTSPLSTKEMYPKIMLLLIEGNGTQTEIINAGEGVTIEFGGEIFEISGSVEDGEYTMSIIPLSDESTASIVLKDNGVKGHLYLAIEGSKYKVHISPVNFKNSKEDGYANFFYAVEDGEGNVTDYGDNSLGEAVVNIEGKKYTIVAIWKDNTMAGVLMPVQE